ncbi:3-oxo-tetronate kinase [Planomicrobium sp. Y74]|uniref:3-oxo-tetronate kinase n=1 Tax=Planomicrobium sp. Y74 TaxID=2478977 RepID=UPI0018F3A983|nr:3-oxo-tetronate kinase [Planomicrobium sp. Y74]
MLIGCIADDFTGGSDIASFFAKGGLSTVLYNGIPEENIDPAKSDVCVIALKTRTQATADAVEDSLKAVKWLKEQGAQQFYVKYCSTFDSTPEGNIGPICDAVMEFLETPYTILCPALPVNGRTVKNGCLYVYGVPLHESSMKDHPLTPMWDYDLTRLMDPQSKFPSFKAAGSENDIVNFTESSKSEAGDMPFYIVPDFEKQEDAEELVKLFGGLKLLTGGSGLAEALAKKHKRDNKNRVFEKLNTSALLLAGSCSETTRNQIKVYEEAGGASYFIDPLKLLSGEESVDNIWRHITEYEETMLLYSSDTPENVKRNKQNGKTDIAGMLEEAIAELAARALEAGYHRIIVAGGETSGAVTKQLGYTEYYIGESIEPGVPIMIPTKDHRTRIVLKSGNFGKPDFFLRALSST